MKRNEEEIYQVYVATQAIKQLLRDDEFITAIKSLIDYAKGSNAIQPDMQAGIFSAALAYQEYEKLLKELDGLKVQL